MPDLNTLLIGVKTMTRPKSRQQLADIQPVLSELIESSQAGGAKEYSFDLHIDSEVLERVFNDLESLSYTIDTEFPGV